MKEILQKMYDDAKWYGYATHKGRRYSDYRISQIANRLSITLDYNCPA